jgi:hypothetical protein
MNLKEFLQATRVPETCRVYVPQNIHYISKIASSNIIHIFIEMLQLNVKKDNSIDRF